MCEANAMTSPHTLEMPDIRLVCRRGASSADSASESADGVSESADTTFCVRVCSHMSLVCRHVDLTPKQCRLFFSGIAISRFRFPCPPTPAATGPGHSAVRRGPRATPQELRSAKLDHRATTYPLLLSVDARRRRPKEGGAPEPSRRVLKDPSLR